MITFFFKERSQLQYQSSKCHHDYTEQAQYKSAQPFHWKIKDGIIRKITNKNLKNTWSLITGRAPLSRRISISFLEWMIFFTIFFIFIKGIAIFKVNIQRISKIFFFILTQKKLLFKNNLIFFYLHGNFCTRHVKILWILFFDTLLLSNSKTWE